MIHKRVDIKPLNYDKLFDSVLLQRQKSEEKLSSKSLKRSSKKLDAAIEYSKKCVDNSIEQTKDSTQTSVVQAIAVESNEQRHPENGDLSTPSQRQLETIAISDGAMPMNAEMGVSRTVPIKGSHFIEFHHISEQEIQSIETKRLFKKYAHVSGKKDITKIDLHHVDTCWCPKCQTNANDKSKMRGYKIVGNNAKLIMNILEVHNMKRTDDQKQCNILWSTQHLKSTIFRSMQRHQKINLFPRSYECTRKDALATNLNAMAETFGKHNFSFLPESYVWPRERDAVVLAMNKSRGQPWIVKPAGSSQGRGILIITSITQLPTDGAGQMQDDNWVVEKYINNPLLLNGKKFDLRLYVCVTSFHPLRIYLHQEGLVRFATESYNNTTFTNPFVHLTNYSINKYNVSKKPVDIDENEDDDDDDEEEEDQTNDVHDLNGHNGHNVYMSSQVGGGGGWNAKYVPLGGSQTESSAKTTSKENKQQQQQQQKQIDLDLDDESIVLGVRRKLKDILFTNDSPILPNNKPPKKQQTKKVLKDHKVTTTQESSHTGLKWSFAELNQTLCSMDIDAGTAPYSTGCSTLYIVLLYCIYRNIRLQYCHIVLLCFTNIIIINIIITILM